MSLSIQNRNLDFALCSHLQTSAWMNQSYELDADSKKSTSVINYSIPGNRLRERMDGSIEIVSKTPGEVVGEYLIRPILDKTYDLSTYTWQIL